MAILVAILVRPHNLAYDSSVFSGQVVDNYPLVVNISEVVVKEFDRLKPQTPIEIKHVTIEGIRSIYIYIYIYIVSGVSKSLSPH